MIKYPPPPNTMPLTPVPAPSITRPDNVMASNGPALIVMLLPPETGTIPASTPLGLVRATAWVMRIGPKPALSIAVTSPPAATTFTACWKFLHGDPNEHGLLSLP